MTTVGGALSAENADLRARLTAAHAQIEALAHDLEDAERVERGLREDLADAEYFAAEAETRAARFGRLIEAVAALADFHDAERHDGPRRWCRHPACVAYLAAWI